MRYRMTRHARRRWAERFHDEDLRAELAEVIPFGDAEHGRKMLLSPCGAVFVVDGRFIVTVLTVERVLDIMVMSDKHRASYLTVSQQYDLNVACKALAPFGYGTFHVGSSLDKSDYHDVDLRCILPDDEYDQMFRIDETEDARLHFLNVAVSEWIAARTGLPIDFQFQRMTNANEAFKGRRNAVGH